LTKAQEQGTWGNVEDGIYYAQLEKAHWTYPSHNEKHKSTLKKYI
jgi:hypothetical protein